MQAAVVREFGKPLVVEDVAVPVPGHGQVLVRVEDVPSSVELR
jgi:propanol-preferring alcohol dehydrogenase